MSKLWFPEILSLESAEAELKNSLAGAWGDGGELKVKEAHIESGRVLLSLQASGAVCGSFWLEGKLTHRAGSGHLSLKDVKLSGAGETPSEMADLIVHVLDRAKISLVSKDWFDEERIMPLEAALRRTVPEKVKFEIQNLEAKDAKIVAATDGLYVLHPLTARLVITGF